MKTIARTISALLFLSALLSANAQSLYSEKISSIGKEKEVNQLTHQVFVTYNYIHNIGQFGKVYEPGQGVLLNYGIHIPKSYLLVIRSGFYTHKLKDGVDTGYASFNVIPLHIGGRYYLSEKVFMPYFSFMNGLNFFTNSDYKGGTNEDSQFLIRYAFQVGFGFDVKLAKSFGVNLNINYNNSFYDEGYYYYGSRNSAMTTGFEYSGGISYFFGD